MIKQKANEFLREILRNHTKSLPFRGGQRPITGREIMCLSLLVTGHSYDEVGKHFDVSAERIRQIVGRVKRAALAVDRKQVEEEKKRVAREKIAGSIHDESPIEVLGLIVQVENRLKAANIFTVGDLKKQSDSDLLRVESLGKKSLRMIKEALLHGGNL